MENKIRTLFFSYWALLFVLTHVPTMPDVSAIPGSDKTLHAVAYCMLAVLAWRAYPPTPSARRGIRMATFWGLGAAYGVADELLQALPMIGRTCELGDWIADVTGVCVGLVAVRLYAWSTR